MDAPSATPTFDDGLYHPFIATPIMLMPTTVPTNIMGSSMSETPNQIVQPIALVKSGSLHSIKSQDTMSSSIPTEVFTSIAAPSILTSSLSPIATLSVSPVIQDLHASKPQHNYVRDGVTALIVILFILGLVAFTAFLTSQRFRRWRENRASRRLDSRWEISRPYYKEDSFTPVMRQAPGTDSNPILILAQTDPFARSIPRQSRMWTAFQYGQESAASPVEEIDEERGWLWGANVDEKEPIQSVTPGLGIGKYRSKYGKGGSLASREMRLSEPEGFDEMKEVLLDDDLMSSEEMPDRPAGPRQDPSRGFPSNGVSYLLTRLKESISGRSRFSSLGSQNSQSKMDISRGRWNEVGQILAEEEKDIATSPEDEEKILGLQDQPQPQHKFTMPRELSLADIALPELPALAWDTLKIGKTKRCRDPSMDVEISTPVRNELSNSRSRRKRVENISSSGKYTNLPTPSSRSRRQRKDAGLTGYHHSTDRVKSRQVYPGGFIGRSPTKKLRRKACPEF